MRKIRMKHAIVERLLTDTSLYRQLTLSENKETKSDGDFVLRPACLVLLVPVKDNKKSKHTVTPIAF